MILLDIIDELDKIIDDLEYEDKDYLDYANRLKDLRYELFEYCKDTNGDKTYDAH